MKLLILLILGAIVASLGTGLFYLLTGDQSKKMVNALTVRIVLSMVLVAALFVAWLAGVLQPHGLG